MTDREKKTIDHLTERYRTHESFDVEAGLASVHSRIRQPVSGVGRRRSPSFWFGIAAGLALVLSLGVYFATSLVNVPYEIVANGDQEEEVSLPDGSRILLKRGGQLAYAADYGQSERRVELRGEAYFEVEPDAERPFLVQRGEVTLRVVGTSFNLKIDQEGSLEVEVSSGRVKLETATDSLPVSKNERGTYRPASGLKKVAAPNLNAHAWRTGELKFSATPLSDVLDAVERAYDVSLIMDKDKLDRCDFPLTATFKEAPLNELLAHLEKLTGGRFVTEESSTRFRLTDWCKE